VANDAGSAQVAIYPEMQGFRSKVTNEVDAAGKESGNRFAAAFGGGIKGVGAFVGKSLAVAGGLAAAVGAIAIKGGISRQLQIEDATAKMTGLGNSTKTVKTTMDNALASVKGTAFGMGEAATVASTALASGIKPGQQMTKYLTLVADAATIAGTGMGEMGTIMGKVTNSGKVTNDVLNQFGDRGVGVLQMLAKHYGVTAEEMTEMVSKGKVDAATFNKVLTENLGGAAQKSGNTTKGAFKNMGAALSRVGVTLSSGFFPLLKDGFNQVTLTLDGVNERIKPAAEAFGKWFQGYAGPKIQNFSTVALAGFNRVIDGAVGLKALLVDGDFTSAFGKAFNVEEDSGLVTFLLRTREIVGNVRESLQLFWAGVTMDAGTRLQFDGQLEGFVAFGARVRTVADSIKTAFGQLDFSSFSAFLASLKTAGGTVGGAFASIGESLTTLAPAFQAFAAQLPNIGGAVAKLASVGLTVLTQALAFLADNVDTIIKFMPLIVAGFVAWRIASAATANAQFSLQAAQVAMTPVITANNILRIIAVNLEHQHALATGAATTAINMNVLSMARQKIAMIAANIANGAMRVGMLAAAAAQWVWNAAMTANPIGLVIAAIAALIAGIVLLVMNWDTVTQFLTNTWRGFVTWFQVTMSGFLSWWNGLWAAVSVRAQVAWNAIVAWVKAIPARIVAALLSLAQLHVQFGSWLLSVKNAAIAKFGEIVTWVRGVPGKILGALGNLGGLLLNAGSQIMGGFFEGLRQKWEDVKNFIGGVGQWIADHKGPKAYDEALLIPNGGWIMGSLEKGLMKKLPSLKSTLGLVADTIQNGVVANPSATLGARQGVLAGAGGGGSELHVHVHPSVGMDAEEFVQKVRRVIKQEFRS
jgi:tape measure domain-containing protein